MTYRQQVSGLGETPPFLTPEAIGMFLKGLVAVGGCNGQVKTNTQAVKCLTAQHVQILGTCKLNAKPPGITDSEFAVGCAALAQCGMFDKVACPDVIQLPHLPPGCLSPEREKELRPTITYCKTYPQHDGPKPSWNAGCWAMSRNPELYGSLMSAAPCAPRMPEPPTRSVVAPAPDDYAAPIDTTPSMVPTEDDIIIETDDPGTSTSTMVMYGIGGALVLGLGYLMFKKK